MDPFSILIKPASADCNLQCEHCFYLDRAALYPGTRVHRMSHDILESLIAGYMATDQPQYSFGWQGGEPTLMGTDFFQQVTELQKKHGRRGAIVANGLQTNATLIKDEMASHFAQYKFLVGVSLDGPKSVHDMYRRNRQGAGSHSAVIRGIDCLKRHHVEFNILTLVSKANVHKPREIYHYLCDQDFLFHQYIPCVEFDDSGRPMPYTISPEEWGDFLCGLYDVWIAKDSRRVSIRLFDAIVSQLVTGELNICHMGTNCCQYFLVEYNGDIYPCDFFVEKGLKLGNIKSTKWNEVWESSLYRQFGRQKKEWNRECSACEWKKFCAGDCLKHRIYPVRKCPVVIPFFKNTGFNATCECGFSNGVYAGNDSRTLSWLCRGWKQFYAHALSGFQKLADSIRMERVNNVPIAFRASEGEGRAIRRNSGPHRMPPGRNDPCPCGSGLKYKKCCLRKG